MLGFAIPLKSRAHSTDWGLVTRLLRRTARSACAQTDPNFRVVVACHEIPEIKFEHPHLEFITVDGNSSPRAHPEQLADKDRKVHAGFKRVLARGATHVMSLDADDCVSHRLASYVRHHPSAHGWYVRSGYFHSEREPMAHRERRRFHQWCGSSHILRGDLLGLADEFVPSWCYRHRPILDHLRGRGTPLAPLPFPGAVYNISHGENINDYAPIIWPRHPVRRWARRIAYQVRITDELRDEFGLYPLGGPAED